LSMMDPCPSLGKLVHPEDSAEVTKPRRQVVA
jgi:hypothetical protein